LQDAWLAIAAEHLGPKNNRVCNINRSEEVAPQSLA
jgi:hypothetical protein